MGEISIKKAAFINACGKYSTVVLQIIVNAILARLLTPEDYGIVIVISVLITFLNLFANMGLETAVIQKKELTNEDYNSLFTLSAVIGILLVLIFIILSYPISIFYDNKVYVPLGIILSFSLLFNALNMIPNGLLLKEKRFVLIAVRTVVVYVSVSIITIILAVLGYKYYALAVQSVLASFFTFIWNLSSVKLRINSRISKESIEKIKSYSLYQFAFNFINYFSRNLDNLLIGKIIGNEALGYYDKAYKTTKYPIDNFTTIISPVLHPIFSEYQYDRRNIYEKYTKIVKLLSLMGVFISVFCYFSAEEIILMLYGDQWITSIPVFKILAISIALQMVVSPAGSIFQSLNNTKLLFKNGFINSCVAIMGIIIGLMLGNIEYIAIGLTISAVFSFFYTYKNVIQKTLCYNFLKFLKLFIPEPFIALIMVLAYKWLYVNLETYMHLNNIIILILAKGLFLLCIYGICMKLFNQLKYFKILTKRSSRRE